MTWQQELIRQSQAIRSLLPEEARTLTFADVSLKQKHVDKLLEVLTKIEPDLLPKGQLEFDWYPGEKINVDFDQPVLGAYMRFFVWQYGDEDPGACIELHFQKTNHTEEIGIDCFPGTTKAKLNVGYFVYEMAETGYEGSGYASHTLTDEQAAEYLKAVNEIIVEPLTRDK